MCCCSRQDSHTRHCHLLTCGSHREATRRRGRGTSLLCHRARSTRGRGRHTIPHTHVANTLTGKPSLPGHVKGASPSQRSRSWSPQEATQTPYRSVRVGSTWRDDSRGATWGSGTGAPRFRRTRGKLTVGKTGCAAAAAVRTHRAPHGRGGHTAPCTHGARCGGAHYAQPRLKPASSSGKAFPLLFLIKMIFCNHESLFN